MEKVDEESHKVFSPKLLSAATSPIKVRVLPKSLS